MNDEKSEPFLPAFITIIIVSFSFSAMGVWAGVLSFIICTIFMGWKKRYEGPFPTNRPDDEI